MFEAQLDTLALKLDTLAGVIDSGSQRRVAAAFMRARLAYKRVEGLLRYYSPDMAGGLDGPLPEADGDAPPRPLGSPAAFQIVEDGVFPLGSDSVRRVIRNRAAGMAIAVRRFRPLTTYLDIEDAPLLEAARLEVARVSTIDLAGVDLERSDSAVVEGATALDGIRYALSRQAAGHAGGDSSTHLWTDADSTLATAASYLRAHSNFERIDRLTFVTAYARPAGVAIAAARASVPEPRLPLRNPWRQNAATVFDSSAFDPMTLASDYAPQPTPALVALGVRLFNEPRLSGPASRSCAFCHQPQRAFSDGRARPELLVPAAPGTPVRRTPTLINSALQPALFDDERAATLEEQVALVLRSPTEMASSADLAAQRLTADSSYRSAFARTFAVSPDSAVTGVRLRVAIAAYVRTLIAMNSRFDRAARGDTSALTSGERHGFNVYMGKARCATCHFAPLFNGATPTSFTVSEPEIIGVPERPAMHHATIDPDSGRAGFDHIDVHLYAFKVPTLRNVALLAPYMHNGAYLTLDQVVDFYDVGGGAGIGTDLPLQTLSRRPLHLTAGERKDLVAFLRALTDTSGLRPTRESRK